MAMVVIGVATMAMVAVRVKVKAMGVIISVVGG